MNTREAGRRISLRAFCEEDEELLVRLYRSTREAELAMVPWDEAQRQSFVRSQHSAQLRHYQTEYPQATHHIIELDGRPAGRVYVDRRELEIRILDITLLPEHRGHGIGLSIIRGLMEEATQTGRSVSTHLDSFAPGNRSQSLFEREGFKAAESNGFYTLFVWSGEVA